MPAHLNKADKALAEALSEFYADPMGYVMFCFPWDDPEADIQQVKLLEPWASRYNSEYGPDKWACEFLDELGEDILDRGFDGQNAVTPIQYTTVSGHGIGKSALVAWLIKFILDTRPYSKGVVTANTADQLKTKTWAELGKWHNMSLTKDWFAYNTGRGAMSIAHKEHGGIWRCDAQTCKEENSEAFAGLHAANSTPFYIFDEAGGIVDKIFEVREGGSTDGEPMTFDFGNGTRKTGRFYENCMGRFRENYKMRSIDSRSVQITSKPYIDRLIRDYGADSDYVKVRVLGQFPSAGDVQFISSDVVEDAGRRLLPVDNSLAPLIIGVDVARFGADRTVIYPRFGNDARSFPARVYRGLDNVQVAGKVTAMIEEFRMLGKNCDALFIDEGGLGAGVVDILRASNYNPIGVDFGATRTIVAQGVYRYKGDEIWGRMRAGLETLCIPPVTEENGVELRDDLTNREYGYTIAGNKMHLESKKDLKARGIESPDLAEALALTYTQDVVSQAMSKVSGDRPAWSNHKYDPYDVDAMKEFE